MAYAITFHFYCDRCVEEHVHVLDDLGQDVNLWYRLPERGVNDEP